MLSVLSPARLCSQQRVSSRRFVAAASSAASHRSTQAADDALGQWLIAAAQKAFPDFGTHATDTHVTPFVARDLTPTDKSLLAKCEHVAHCSIKALSREHKKAPEEIATPLPYAKFYEQLVTAIFKMPTESYEQVFLSTEEATEWTAHNIPPAERHILVQQLEAFAKQIHHLHTSKAV